MNNQRRLSLKREHLSDLTPDELGVIAGATGTTGRIVTALSAVVGSRTQPFCDATSAQLGCDRTCGETCTQTSTQFKG